MNNFNNLIVTKWGAQLKGHRFPCSVGRSGIGHKTKEGDGITPSGVWKIEFVMVRESRLSFLSDYKIKLRDVWSDDPSDPKYNQLKKFDKSYNSENLWRSDPLYDLIAVTNFNSPIIKKGVGSAIFLHTWRKARHPTEGCIAFSLNNLLWILNNWNKNSLIMVKG